MTSKVPHEEEVFGLVDALTVISSWTAQDTYPWMRRLAISYLAPRLALLFSTLVLGGHVIWAMKSGSGVNFQRGGAPVVFISAVCYAVIEWHEPKAALLDGGPVRKLRLFNPLFLLPLLAAIGTLVWGYGDLLPFFATGGSG